MLLVGVHAARVQRDGADRPSRQRRRSRRDQHTERHMAPGASFGFDRRSVLIRSECEVRTQYHKMMSLTGSRIARSIVFAAAVLTTTQAEAICSQGFRLAGNDIAYLYTGAYIDSLGYADQARQRMSAGLVSLPKKQTTPSDTYSATIDALAALELGAKDFECAASLIASQKRLPVDPTNDVPKGATD